MTEISTSLVRDCEVAELSALTSWYESVSPLAASAIDAGHRRLGGGLLVHASVDVLMFNRVLGLGVTVPALERDVDQALEHFRLTGARRCMIQVAPGAEPSGLIEWLEARGFYRHNHWIRLVRELSEPIPLAPTNLRLAQFGAEQALEFGRLEAEAFQHPLDVAEFTAGLVGRSGWEFFGAFEGDDLVAAAGMRTHGPVAWFSFNATRADQRGRGAQSALIAAHLVSARDAGCRAICAETAADTPEKPNPSTHNLRRMGFRDAYERPNWVKVLKEG
jgi:GNAT superfamily N-acetyltransferase